MHLHQCNDQDKKAEMCCNIDFKPMAFRKLIYLPVMQANMYNVSRHQSFLPDMQRPDVHPGDAGSFDEAAAGTRMHLHVAKGKGAHSEVCSSL